MNGQEDWEETAYAKRKINKDLAHCIQHIKAKQYEFAINILKAALKRERKSKRNGEPGSQKRT